MQIFNSVRPSQVYFAIFVTALLCLIFTSNTPIVHALIFSNFGLFSLVLMAASVVGILLKFEEKEYGSKELALIGMLSALSAVSRIPFAALPNIQPCTFIIMISGLVFGPMAGFMVGCITPLASNAFLGHGPWTVLQMFSWGAIGGFSGVVGKYAKTPMSTYFKNRAHRALLALYSALCGIAYGVIADLWFAFAFYPFEEKFWLASLAAGLGFNLAHAFGNAFFTWVLGPRFIQVLARFKKRMHVEILSTTAEPQEVPA